MGDVIVICEKISKRYSIRPTVGTGWHRNRRVLVDDLAQFTNVLRGKKGGDNKVTFWALKDVSFSAVQGDVIGVIGSNGAGKSTLLKILSRVTEPTSGRAVITGRVGSLLEVGTGFHSELTGRENIFISGSIIGMSRAEIKKKFDEIVSFSGVEKFLDTPVKRFSSGMEVRLAFSIAAHLNPELLLVDEVLSVGDASFQQKSIAKIQDVSRNGGVILFVSHNMTTVASLCNKAIVLDHGSVSYEIGGVPGAIEHYLNLAKKKSPKPGSEARFHQKNQKVIINDFQVVDVNGFKVFSLSSGMPAKFAIDYSVSAEIEPEDVGFGLLIKTLSGEVIANLNSAQAASGALIKNSEGKVSCSVNHFPIAPGTITITLVVQHRGEVLDIVEDVFVGEVSRDGHAMEKIYKDHKGWVEIENDWE
jgi:lipopolysaccharide transport system ATP-binding protein